MQDSDAPVLECRARERKEEKLQITFSGMNGRKRGTMLGGEVIREDSACPIQLLGSHTPPLVGVEEEETVLQCSDFKYELQYANNDAEEMVSRAVGLVLKRAVEEGGTIIVS